MGEITYPGTIQDTIRRVVDGESFSSLTTDTISGTSGPLTINSTVDLSGNTITDSDDDVIEVQGQELRLDNDGTVTTLTSRAPKDASYVTTSPESGLSGETVASDLASVYDSPVPVGEADLRLDTGQAIEDGSGNARLTTLSDFTVLHDSNGRAAFTSRLGVKNAAQARSNTPYRIEDNEGQFIAVQYDTDSTAGVLRTTNAGVRVEEAGFPSTGDGVEIVYFPSSDKGTIQSLDRGTTTFGELEVKADPVILNAQGGLIDASQRPANLRLATGQSIEDESGTERITIRSNDTQINDENGQLSFQADATTSNTIYSRNGNPVRVFDSNGGFPAVKYLSSSSAPGTLELTNADINLSKNRIVTSSTLDAAGIITEDSANEVFELSVGGNGYSSWDILIGRETKSNINVNINGEVAATDNDGNATTLT